MNQLIRVRIIVGEQHITASTRGNPALVQALQEVLKPGFYAHMGLTLINIYRNRASYDMAGAPVWVVGLPGPALQLDYDLLHDRAVKPITFEVTLPESFVKDENKP